MNAQHVVVDTNVVVSGLLNPFGKPGALMDSLLARRLRLVYDDRILVEYMEVLARPRFAFTKAQRDRFFAIMPFQTRVQPIPWIGEPSPDPADTMFLEAALAANVCLVTGNLRHFPERCRGLVHVVSVTEWIEQS